MEDTCDRLAPEKLANGVPSGMDAIVHDCRMLMTRHGRDPNFVLVSANSRNAFNTFSCQPMLNLVTLRTSTLAHFLNFIYSHTFLDLFLRSSPSIVLKRRESMRRGDPASMLLFSLSVKPLVCRISLDCHLLLNRWYADDGTFVGRIPQFAKALCILQEIGPGIGFHMNISKCPVYCSAILPASLTSLTYQCPLQVADDGSISILGAPIETDYFKTAYLDAKINSCSGSLRLLNLIPDAEIQFTLQWMTGSVCRVEHVFRLTPPSISMDSAYRIDELLRDAYSHFNDINLSPSMPSQISLPFRLVVHGFTLLVV